MEFTWNAIIGLIFGFITGTVAPKAIDRWDRRRDRDLDALARLAGEYELVSTKVGVAFRDKWLGRNIDSDSVNEAQRSFWVAMSRVEVVASKGVVEAAWQLRNAIHHASRALNDPGFTKSMGIDAIDKMNAARRGFYVDIRKRTRLASGGYPAPPDDDGSEGHS